MQISRVRRVGALIVGLALVASACGDDDDEGGAATTAAAETTTAGAETTMAGGDAVCEGESDGQLHIGTVLPQTGNLAFLGPPEFAAVELAVNDINAAGGVLGKDVLLTQGDSGDTSTDIANQTVDAGPVSYTHLTLPTSDLVEISVVAVSLKQQKK